MAILFANQRPEGLERLAGLTSIVSVKAGQVIIEENRLDKRFFEAHSGIEIQHTLCPECSIAKFPHFYARPEAPPAERH